MYGTIDWEEITNNPAIAVHKKRFVTYEQTNDYSPDRF